MKTWQKPQLIVLVRGEPQEAILTNCKSEVLLLSPHYAATGCSTAGAPGVCVACQDPVGS